MGSLFLLRTITIPKRYVTPFGGVLPEDTTLNGKMMSSKAQEILKKMYLEVCSVLWPLNSGFVTWYSYAIQCQWMLSPTSGYCYPILVLLAGQQYKWPFASSMESTLSTGSSVVIYAHQHFVILHTIIYSHVAFQVYAYYITPPSLALPPLDKVREPRR